MSRAPSAETAYLYVVDEPAGLTTTVDWAAMVYSG
jgi:hypothetical protein